MAAPATRFNPYYPTVGIQFTDGLDAIIAAPDITAEEELFERVVTYIAGLYYTSPTIAQLIELKAVVITAANNYMNGGVNAAAYDGRQRTFINMLCGAALTNYITADTIDSRILDVESNIPKSGLSFDGQSPLFLATLMGTSCYDYFHSLIVSPPTPNPWGTYLDDAEVSAIANLPFWTSACMEGALIGDKLSVRGMIEPTTDIVGIEIICSLAVALTVTAGKIMFKWIPKMKV